MIRNCLVDLLAIPARFVIGLGDVYMPPNQTGGSRRAMLSRSDQLLKL